MKEIPDTGDEEDPYCQANAGKVLVSVDEWIVFKTTPTVALALKQMRIRLNDCFLKLMQHGEKGLGEGDKMAVHESCVYLIEVFRAVRK